MNHADDFKAFQALSTRTHPSICIDRNIVLYCSSETIKVHISFIFKQISSFLSPLFGKLHPRFRAMKGLPHVLYYLINQCLTYYKCKIIEPPISKIPILRYFSSIHIKREVDMNCASSITFASPGVVKKLTKLFGSRAKKMTIEMRPCKDVPRFIQKVEDAHKKAAKSRLVFK